MEFANPYFLLLLLLLVPMWFRYRKSGRAISFPTSAPLAIKGKFSLLPHLMFIVRCAALVLLVLTLARPQTGEAEVKRITEGLDIIMVVDTSGSMRAQDFIVGNSRPTRLDVIKGVMANFIKERPNDRIGMVVFGSEAFTQAPLTLDHEVLVQFLAGLSISMAGDGTAIGDGVATGLKRLKDIKSKGRVMILLTDGENTAGRVDPLAAAEAAKALETKIYTIGVGKKGEVPIVQHGRQYIMKTSIDEKLLTKMAKTTGGKYFRAQDVEALTKIYQTIDKLEKVKEEVKFYKQYEEKYSSVLWPALFLLLLEIGLSVTRFKRIP